MSDLFKHTVREAEVLSLYPIVYVSSKGEAMLIDDAEAMNDFRLVTVYNKLKALDDKPGDVGRLYEALYCEIQRRGLDPQFRGGRPPQEPPPLGEPLDEGFA